MIEIDDDYGQLVVVLFGGVQCFFEVDVEGQMVGQVGQWIVVCQIVDVCFLCFVGVKVGEDCDVMGNGILWQFVNCLDV